MVSTLLSDPGSYLVANGKTRTAKSKTASLGTGLVVTPDGYVVTNAHVVEPDQDEVKAALVSTIAHLVDEEVTGIEKGLRNMSMAMTDEDKAGLQKELSVQHARTARVTDMSRSVFSVMGYTGTGDDVQIQRHPCKVKKVGKKAPGKDVAICKMDGDDFPTLPLAASLDDGGVRTGAELFIMGYPGELALDSSFSLPSRLEASLTSGHVSGVKEIADGDWKAIQTDASISPGNSGGPAFHNSGQVVGLATFTIQGERTQNLNFAVSVDVVQEFLRDLQVTPSQSAFTTTYLQALDAYEAGDTHRALALFQRLSADHPESSVVRAKVRQLSGGQPLPAISSPLSPSSSAVVRPAPALIRAPIITERRRSGPKIVLIFVGGALILMLVVVILANYRRSTAG
jgi:serine protease Do